MVSYECIRKIRFIKGEGRRGYFFSSPRGGEEEVFEGRQYKRGERRRGEGKRGGRGGGGGGGGRHIRFMRGFEGK